MKPKLETTSNYGLFQSNEEQRPVHQCHVKRLAESMLVFGYMASKPILCYKKGSKLVVVDGHHRLAAATSIKIPVFYIVEDPVSQKAMIATGEAKPWAAGDCVRLYSLRGLEDYAELASYAEFIPVTMACSILAGESAASGNQQKALRDGTWKIKTRAHMSKIMGLISELVSRHPAVKGRPFIDALSKCLFTPEFDYVQFRDRLFENEDMIDKMNSTDKMLRLFEAIYNKRSRDKTALYFLVTENSRKRHRQFGQSK
jgi:hypothetical protein